jgi:hypothetical protein
LNTRVGSISEEENMAASQQQIASSTSYFSGWTAPLWGVFRSADEAARLGEDCREKIFVVTGAYSGIGV